MYPLSPESVLEILTGRKTRPIATSAFASQGWNISQVTLNKLLDGDPKVNLKKLKTAEGQRFANWYKTYTNSNDFPTSKYRINFEAHWDEWQNAKDNNEHDLFKFLILFPHTISCAIWTEEFCHYLFRGEDFLSTELFHPEGPYGFFSTEQANEFIKRKLVNRSIDDMLNVLDLFNFILFIASVELDIQDWDTEIEIPLPSFFTASKPTKGNKTADGYNHPIWNFFKWLKSTSESETWKKLKESHYYSDDIFRKWKSSNSKISWDSLFGILNQLDPRKDSIWDSPYKLKVCFAFAITRLSQANFNRCKEAGERYFFNPGNVESFYHETISEAKNWGRRKIPLHPRFGE